MGIFLRNCDIRDGTNAILRSVTFSMRDGERWLVTGTNDSGASALISALAGKKEILPSDDGSYENRFGDSVALVSLEAAAWLIEEERRRDDSDFVEGGVDIGRTPRAYIAETLSPSDVVRYPAGRGLESHPAVIQCGIARILDRGLKYLSTGEIRRTLFCRALTSKIRLLILDEPFDGLDAASRDSLSRLLSDGIPGTQTIVAMDSPDGIPNFISHVLEISDGKVSFQKYTSFIQSYNHSDTSIFARVSSSLGRSSFLQEPIRDNRNNAASKDHEYVAADNFIAPVIVL